MCDIVVCDNYYINYMRVLIVFVVMNGVGMVIFKNNIVRLWDNDMRLMIKGLYFLMIYVGVVIVFDVNWEWKVVVVGDFGGLVFIVNFEFVVLEIIYDIFYFVV